MKKFLLLASLVFATGAQAATVDWKIQLEDYKQYLQTLDNKQLVVRTAFYSVKAIATCGASAAMTAAAFVADTAPITGVVSEIIANNANPEYQTWEKILSVDSLASAARTTAGGGVVGVAEALEFVNLWLGGNEDLAFGQLKKTYASTFATAEALFADQSQCLMSYSKVLLTRVEMQKRGMMPKPYQAPTQQQQLPVEQTRP